MLLLDIHCSIVSTNIKVGNPLVAEVEMLSKL